MKIRSLESLTADDMLPPVAGVGTPEVSIERPGGHGVLHALQKMSEVLSIEYTTMIGTEVGGSNGLQPLEMGSSKYYNIPTVDADLMGKCFALFDGEVTDSSRPSISKFRNVLSIYHSNVCERFTSRYTLLRHGN